MRMAYIDQAPPTTPNGRVALCLHGEPTWSYLYRKMIPPLLSAGYRVIAPDLFGFGRSDKPIDPDWFRFSTHRQSLIELIESLQLERITLIVQDWGGLLGLTLPHELPDRFEQLLVMNTTLGTGDLILTDGFKAWRAFVAGQKQLNCLQLMQRACPHLSPQELAAYAMPFKYENPADQINSMRGVMRFPALVPEFESDDGAAISRVARTFWRNEWRGQSFMAIGMADPVLGPRVMHALHRDINACPPPMEIDGGGHFVQEWETGNGHIASSIVAAALDAWGMAIPTQVCLET